MNNTSEVIKSTGVLYDMLKDRGIDASILKQFSEDEINKFIFTIDIPNETTNEKIKIVYDMSPKFKWVDTKKLLENEDSYKLIILVIKDKLNNTESKKISDLNVDYQIFDIKDLQFNISHHTLVPKHELISDEVKIQEILTNYQVKKCQLPLILKTDPMCKYLNAKVGNLMKITRISPTSCEYIVYRSVV